MLAHYWAAARAQKKCGPCECTPDKQETLNRNWVPTKKKGGDMASMVGNIMGALTGAGGSNSASQSGGIFGGIKVPDAGLIRPYTGPPLWSGTCAPNAGCACMCQVSSADKLPLARRSPPLRVRFPFCKHSGSASLRGDTAKSCFHSFFSESFRLLLAGCRSATQLTTPSRRRLAT